MKRTHMNWSDDSKHSLWLIGRKKLRNGRLFWCISFCIVAYSTMSMILIFCWSDPDFSFQLNGRSRYHDIKVTLCRSALEDAILKLSKLTQISMKSDVENLTFETH